jgi:hypothetical protein
MHFIGAAPARQLPTWRGVRSDQLEYWNSMQNISLLFTGLAGGGLLMAGLGAKAMATVLIEPVPELRRVITLAFAFLVLLLGALTAGYCMDLVLPPRWGSGAYWVLFIGACGTSIGLPVWWITAKHRRAALNAPLVDAPPTGMTTAAAAAANGQRQVWPHPQLAAGLAAIRAARLHRAKRDARIVLVLAAPITCLVALKFGLPGVCIALVVTALLAMNGYSTVNGVCGIEYRTLPGSTDASGKHRCVYCGHRGVYRSGEYKTSSTWHQCTGCRKHLFVD